MQPIASQGEAARRASLNTYGAITGSLVWGTGFETGGGLQEIIPEVQGGSSTVTKITTNTNSGAGAIQLYADAVNTDYAGFYRYGPIGGNISKLGVLFAAYPNVYASALTTMRFGLSANYWGLGNDEYIAAWLKISREAGGSKKLYYYNAAGAYVDTGITVDDFFISTGDAVQWPYWHSIKVVLNPTVNPPKYSYVEIDGHRFDLSAFTPYWTNSAGAYWKQRNYFSSFISCITNEAVAKSILIDDLNITINEP